MSVFDALKSAPNTSSSPDGISYRLLKEIANHIIYPLTVIGQQSFYASRFPAMWKHAAIIPLFKVRGLRADVRSYRPISLCSCLGKILEKIACGQLKSFLAQHDLLHSAQHGFVTGRSTTTSLLAFDTYISNIISAGHPYNVVSFDFQKAFDKAPHQDVIDALVRVGVNDQALSWIKRCHGLQVS
jgi:hypothetical protein